LQITRIVVIMAPTPHSQLLLSEIDGEQEWKATLFPMQLMAY
jgi:hypothetical protein